MSDWLSPYAYSPHVIVCPFSPEFWGLQAHTLTATNGSVGTLVANRAYVQPFLLQRPVVVTKLGWINGATVAGNVDVAIYDNNLDLILSCGSTAQSGTNAKQTVDVTDTTLRPGIYYMAMAVSDGTATVSRMGISNLGAFNAGGQRLQGFFRQDSTGPALPSTIGGTAGFTHTIAPVCYAVVGRLV